MIHRESPSTALREPSPSLGEKDGMRGFGSWKGASIASLRSSRYSRSVFKAHELLIQMMNEGRVIAAEILHSTAHA
jgi:hypothetical protein